MENTNINIEKNENIMDQTVQGQSNEEKSYRRNTVLYLKNALKLYIHDIKTIKGFIIGLIVASLGIFVGIPILIMMLQDLSISDVVNEDSTILLKLVTALIPIYTSYSVILELSYLHNKRKADFYGSLPIGARALLVEKLFVGLTKTLLPMVVTNVVGFVFCGFDPYICLNLFKFDICLGILVTGNILFGSFICLCCGKAVDTVVTYLLVNLVYCLATAVICFLPSSIIPGMVATDGEASLSIIMYGSPMATIMGFLSGGIGGFPSINFSACRNMLIFWIVFSVILAAAQIFIVKFRKAEVAQDKFAFGIAQTVIKFCSALTASILTGEIFLAGCQSGESNIRYLGLYTLGATMAAIITYVILTGIYNRSLKNFKKMIPAIALTVFVSVGSIIIVATGGFGSDTYIPSEASVEYAEIYINTYNYEYYDHYYYNEVVGENYAADSNLDNVDDTIVLSGDAADRGFIAKSKTDIEMVMKVQRDMQDYYSGTKTMGMYSLRPVDSIYANYTISIVYHLKNGKTDVRQYEYYNNDVTFIPEAILKNWNLDGTLRVETPEKILVKNNGDKKHLKNKEQCKLIATTFADEYEKLSDEDKKDYSSYSMVIYYPPSEAFYMSTSSYSCKIKIPKACEKTISFIDK